MFALLGSGYRMSASSIGRRPGTPAPKLLAEHAIKRAINVLIRRVARATCHSVCWKPTVTIPHNSTTPARTFWRVFQVCSASPLNVNTQAKLQEGFDHGALMTREMSHRVVKNSLTSVVRLLRVQARGAP
jgi:two-component sensor histidine kinase